MKRLHAAHEMQMQAIENAGIAAKVKITLEID
jgi:hypothetical protein